MMVGYSILIGYILLFKCINMKKQTFLFIYKTYKISYVQPPPLPPPPQKKPLNNNKLTKIISNNKNPIKLKHVGAKHYHNYCIYKLHVSVCEHYHY